MFFFTPKYFVNCKLFIEYLSLNSISETRMTTSLSSEAQKAWIDKHTKWAYKKMIKKPP